MSGRAVKSSDIKATQEYITSLPNAFDKTFVTNYLDRMEVPDDGTMIYHLKKPLGYIFNMAFLGSGTGQPLLPAETLSPGLNTNRQIGSGPYTVETQQIGVGATYKKNPKFRDASKNLPYIAEREFKIISDPIAAEAAFRSGQLDWHMAGNINITNNIKRDLGANHVYQLVGIADSVFRWNTSRQTNTPWKDDVRIREAIWRLTNWAQLLELIYGGAGVQTYGLIPASLTRWLPDQKEVVPFWQEDVAKATQLLRAANWNPDQQVTLLVSTANQEVMIVYQQQLLRGGIKSVIDTFTGLGKFFEKITDGTYDAFSDEVPGSGDPYVPIRHQHTNSWSDVYRGFALNDKNLDAMIEKSEQTLDLEENVKLVRDIQMEAIRKFTLSYVLYTRYRNYLLQPRVQNLDLSVANPIARTEAWVRA